MAGDGSETKPVGDTTAPVRTSNAMAPLVIAALVIAGLYFARPILEPLALAVLLSLLLAPAVGWLQHHGLRRAPAVLAAVLLSFFLFLGLLAAVGEQAVGFARDLPQYEQNIADKLRALSGVPGSGLVERVSRVFHDIAKDASLTGAPAEGASPARAPVPVEIHTGGPLSLQFLSDVVGPLLGPLASAGLVLLFVTMILLKREDLRDRVLRLAGVRDLHRTTSAMNEAADRVSRYLLMQLVVGVCFGVPVGIGLWLIGIPDALLWGLLGVVLRFIPYLGGPITAILPVILAIAVMPGWGALVWTVLLFAAAEAVVANVVEPWAYGRSTGLSAVAVVAASVFWAWLWGAMGLLLATPMTVCLVVLGRHVPHLQFLDILLGNQPVLSPQETLYQRLLAHDPEEAAEQAEEFAATRSLAAFFDDVAIPALAMAQADSERGALTSRQRAMIAEGLAAMLENLAEDGFAEGAEAEDTPATVVCLAGRNELDLAAAWLLQHLLRTHGCAARVFSPEAVATFNLDRLPLRGVSVVCLSLLSTGSAARARYLVRRIRRRARRVVVVVGYWGHDAREFSIEEAVSATAADRVVTTLGEAVAAIASVVSSPALAALPGERQSA